MASPSVDFGRAQGPDSFDGQPTPTQQTPDASQPATRPTYSASARQSATKASQHQTSKPMTDLTQ